MAQVVAVPLGERGQERLGDEVIGSLAVGAPSKVAVDVRGVPVEQDREPLRLLPGTLNDRSIIGGGPPPLHPPPAFMSLSFRVLRRKRHHPHSAVSTCSRGMSEPDANAGIHTKRCGLKNGLET